MILCNLSNINDILNEDMMLLIDLSNHFDDIEDGPNLLFIDKFGDLKLSYLLHLVVLI